MVLNPTRMVGDATYVGYPLGSKPASAEGTVATGWTGVEMGKGMRHTTIITLTTAVSIIATPDTEALAGGKLMYTFPAGQIWVHKVYGDVSVDIADDVNDGDQPEVGLGTVVATGAVATLGAGAATWENIWGPHIVTPDSEDTAATAAQFLSRTGGIILGGGVHTVYFNIADTWANGAGTADVKLHEARFILDWTLIPAEGL